MLVPEKLKQEDCLTISAEDAEQLLTVLKESLVLADRNIKHHPATQLGVFYELSTAQQDELEAAYDHSDALAAWVQFVNRRINAKKAQWKRRLAN